MRIAEEKGDLPIFGIDFLNIFNADYRNYQLSHVCNLKNQSLYMNSTEKSEATILLKKML